MRPRLLLPILLALAPLALPAAAGASDFQRIFGDYRSDGELNGCYNAQQLHNAGREIPPDIEQYTPGFGDALAVAQGRCSSPTGPAPEEAEEPAASVSAGTPGPGAPEAPLTKAAVKDPPAPEAVTRRATGNVPDLRLNVAQAAISSETPGALIALLVAVGLALLIALAWAVVWFMGWSPERLTKPLFATFQTAWDRLIPGR